MRKRVIIYVCIAQLLIITAISVRILFKKQSSVLGEISVSSVNNRDITSSPSGDLNFFYEPNPNSLIKDDENEAFYGEYTINNDSLNAPKNYKVEKDPSTVRIITLGDSFTYGLHVNTKENWVSLLEKTLNSTECNSSKKFEIINLGMVGYDSEYEVERFKKRGSKYNPDLIVWLIVDIYRVRDLIMPLMQKYKDKGIPGKQIDSGGKINTNWGRAMNELITKYGYERLLTYNKNSIDKMREYYKGELVLIPVPKIVDERGRQALKDLSNKYSWHYFDGMQDFFKLDGYLTNDNHPNKKGHRLIAQNIYRYLTDSKIVNCR